MGFPLTILAQSCAIATRSAYPASTSKTNACRLLDRTITDDGRKSLCTMKYGLFFSAHRARGAKATVRGQLAPFETIAPRTAFPSPSGFQVAQKKGFCQVFCGRFCSN